MAAIIGIIHYNITYIEKTLTVIYNYAIDPFNGSKSQNVARDKAYYLWLSIVGHRPFENHR
jgi:hypothetical protein